MFQHHQKWKRSSKFIIRLCAIQRAHAPLSFTTNETGKDAFYQMQWQSARMYIQGRLRVRRTNGTMTRDYRECERGKERLSKSVSIMFAVEKRDPNVEPSHHSSLETLVTTTNTATTTTTATAQAAHHTL